MADIDLPEALARELATVGAREHWLSLSHGATRYLEAGNGPTLVALHGFAGPSGADRYLHMMPYWTSRFRVIAVDMLNWGPGARPKHEYSSPLHIVDALRELLDAIEVDRCFIVGHCYGGRVALKLTAQSPHRVRGLVVAALGTRAPDLATHLPLSPIRTEADMRALIERRMGHTPEVDYDSFAKWSWRSLRRQPALMSHYVEFLRHFEEPSQVLQMDPRRAMWSNIDVPILFAWGDDDASAPLEDAPSYLAAIPSAKLVTCEGNHFFPNRYVERFSIMVSSFFDEGMVRRTA